MAGIFRQRLSRRLVEPVVQGAWLVEAIERAMERGFRNEQNVREADEARERLAQLTPREREIAVLLAAGHPNKEIAARLGLSIRTVENHRAQIRTKARIRSMADLMRLLASVDQAR